ncbi:MAG: hydantoinase B/oxoprolinase family protein [Phenylobacterium sp.]
MTQRDLDGAELAVLNNRLQGVARKMANTLLRAGRSGVLNRGRDFSACVVNANCELIAAAESLPIHVLSGPDLMARAMLAFHPDIRPGDAFLHNSPYHGCSHPADHTILVPVIDPQGVHRFTVVAKAHQADIGNSIPTTYHGTAQDVYEEGALIFPAVRVQTDYKTNEDIVRMCEMRIRVPEQWHGDFLAMLGAARIGERELLMIGEELGWERLERFDRQWLDYSETRMAAAIAKVPAGRAEATSVHDAIPGTPAAGISVTSKVTVDPIGGYIEVDLRDNPDCLPCGLNLSEACARTSALIGVFNSIDPTVPKNAGAFRRVRVLLREGCVVGIPFHPTSCSVATTNVADRVSGSTQRAMAMIGDGFGMAEIGAGLSPSSGVISGVDPRSGKVFINQVFMGHTAGAACAANDAWLTYLHGGNGGLCFIDSVELDEVAQPVIIRERRLVADTEGAGRTRGAPCLHVEFEPDGCDVDVAYVCDGVVNAPLGVRGGLDGGGARQFIREVGGSAKSLPSATVARLLQGEVLVCLTTGGGGYGDPFERPSEKVRHDVREGWITSGRAETVYGVALTAAGEVDLAKTEELRARP